MKRCVLHVEKICNDCNECADRCDLDPQKICDNCFRCLEQDTRAFADIPISGVFFEEDFSGEREGRYSVDFEDGYVLDSDESWKDGPLFHIRTLPQTFGVRRRGKPHCG
jgi:hypothetical protein